MNADPRLNSPLLPWLAALVGGVLFFLGYVGFDQFYLEWIALVPVLWAIRGQRPKRAFLIGWVAGTVAHLGGFYWIVGMFRQFAGAPLPVGVLGLVLLAMANGIVFAAWAWSTRLITGRTGWSVVWVAPVCWTVAEFVWPEIFPNYLGASQYLLPRLTQIADLTGILGVSFLLVYINATVYHLLVSFAERRAFPVKSAATLVAVLVLVVTYGSWRIGTVGRETAAAAKLKVGLVQTNRGGAENLSDPDARVREHQQMSRSLAASGPVDLIVWPEGICGLRMSSREGSIPPALLGATGTPMLVGACIVQQQAGKTMQVSNSALLTDPAGKILGTYDKSILVPFGEYIPLGDLFPVLYSWLPYTAKFTAGTSNAPLMLGNHPLSVSICYEDIFPARIRRLMRGGGERNVPQVMFNLTNDSWYGNSTEPMEHLALASFRSIEHRRALVRVTNTGISAFVDPVGRIVSRTGVWTREAIEDRVPLMNGRTIYLRFGDWLGWLCTLLAAAGLALSWKKARNNETAS
ncbi:apolipoprotein N-acyltransferase [Geomonas sp. Red32]|uniref:apolipoprotein N-acyltransferase n=1 Tax=Geomonas sp. Red32 TaxID=2912856 RepID=UPI00202CCBDD|nr:apolipoprotein N-acyltransferase [Geomonas sp. Red32]